MTTENENNPIPDICEQFGCEVINSKPASNYFLARMDISGTWQAIGEINCDPGCSPDPPNLAEIDAEPGDCAWLPCQCPDTSGDPVPPGPVAP